MKRQKIIALLGKSKSGKDTAGQMLLDAVPGGVRIAFADKLKQICGEMYGLSDADMNTEKGKARPTELRCLTCPLCGSVDTHEVKLEREMKAECKSCGAVGEREAFKGFWTPRMILQYIGTEGFRRIDPNVWVKYALRKAASHLAGNEVGYTNDHPAASFVVITDCRFRSEMAGVVAAGGEIWRIRRPETDGVSTGLAKHASETEMDGIPDAEFHRIIVNDGSLDDLRMKVTAALAQFLDSHGG